MTSAGTGTVPVRPYRQPVPRLWWLRRRSYLLFMLRELSCVFIAWFVVFLLMLVDAVGSGPGAYRDFLDWSARPWVITLNVLALAFVLLHAVTWFNLAPKAMVVRLRGRQIPPVAVAGAHYALWAVCSAIAAWVILR
ncbi:fumarate reductase subunit C [Rhodococcus sp. NPDC058514]|uniref:fumarate reductase subunit C n=1 Tax=unclassified Rhodococcus (in: high G+C Gram-positive bacteria) TaxID=192944 RepID=UPI00364DF979